MLELKDISYTLPDGKEILKHIDLTVKDNEFMVITGPNGGGKSTLAKVVMGILTPTSGRIYLDGRDITDLDITNRANIGISFAFQQPVRFKGITVRDLLSLASNRDLSTREACELLTEVGLRGAEYVEREVDATFSGGELKRIEIAIALARESKLSIFDEPEAGIDLWSFKNLIAVFEHLQGDFTAREVLADLAGMTVNDTTNQLTTRIIFGKEKHPQLVYTDLAEEFPGYSYEMGEDNRWHNMYRGVDLGYGGYVYAEPGMYCGDTALLDVASLHPHSIIALNLFGKYTEHFEDLVNARIHIKHGEYDAVRNMFGGRLAKYLDDESTAKQLAQALKIAINSVYGLTSASFDNPFRDPRNRNNIVALRGALFMKTLQDEVAARGFTVIGIRTDSIKIADATPEIIQFCMDFAKKYKYDFEHEATYDRICLVNDAVYIARYSGDESINGSHVGQWTATGKQFQVPYVFKSLFSHEDLVFDDLCVTQQVKSALYLDMNEGLPATTEAEKELGYRDKHDVVDDFIGYKNPAFKEVSDDELRNSIAQGHNYIFVGRIGQFCPIKPGCGGGVLLREQNGKYYAAAGSKGYRWMESEMVRNLGKEDQIDVGYFNKLVDDAIDNISKYGDFEAFVA